MKKVSGKELRQDTEKTINNLLSQFEIKAPSKRTRKVVEKVSRRLSKELKHEIKKQLKKNQKATKRTKVVSVSSDKVSAA
jgi:glutamyl-tRNA reductase